MSYIVRNFFFARSSSHLAVVWQISMNSRNCMKVRAQSGGLRAICGTVMRGLATPDWPSRAALMYALISGGMPLARPSGNPIEASRLWKPIAVPSRMKSSTVMACSHMRLAAAKTTMTGWCLVAADKAGLQGIIASSSVARRQFPTCLPKRSIRGMSTGRSAMSGSTALASFFRMGESRRTGSCAMMPLNRRASREPSIISGASAPMMPNWSCCNSASCATSPVMTAMAPIAARVCSAAVSSAAVSALAPLKMPTAASSTS
mmetsp:Transcript_148927/g.414967  ORF Transcript_148927/g.414967 Transcript_148927/m.414967 type:complete len:261 (+) Transcript_148927:936-1718(+)